MDTLLGFHPVLLAGLAGLFTWLMTAAGASLVFFFKGLGEGISKLMLGFAAGVMIAASFWSLLAPAIELSADRGTLRFVPAVVGFLLGGVFLRLLDRIVARLPAVAGTGNPDDASKRSGVLLTLAITLHNIPEGLAVGVAFGAVTDQPTLIAAAVLAFGVGVQNFPEGAAVSIPLRSAGLSRRRSFYYGQLSAIVEPLAALAGAWLVGSMGAILPYALAFAAGAMIFVVVEELVPESRTGGGSDLAAPGAMAGFAVMMLLDVALG